MLKWGEIIKIEKNFLNVFEQFQENSPFIWKKIEKFGILAFWA